MCHGAQDIWRPAAKPGSVPRVRFVEHGSVADAEERGRGAIFLAHPRPSRGRPLVPPAVATTQGQLS